jgi:hypothetical protein
VAASIRELAAELELLEEYDHRRSGWHDFGCGQRGMELLRRRRELALALEPGERWPAPSHAELVAAYARVGAPRYRRAVAEAQRYHSKGAIHTLAVWSSMRRRYGVDSAPFSPLPVGEEL